MVSKRWIRAVSPVCDPPNSRMEIISQDALHEADLLFWGGNLMIFLWCFSMCFLSVYCFWFLLVDEIYEVYDLLPKFPFLVCWWNIKLWHAHIPSYVGWWNRLKSWWNIPSCVDQILLSRSVGWPWGMVQRYVQLILESMGIQFLDVGWMCVMWDISWDILITGCMGTVYSSTCKSNPYISFSSTQTVIAIMEEKFIIKLL